MADYQNRVSSSFNERMRLIRFRRKREHTRFRDELQVIPRGLKFTVAFLYVLAVAIGVAVNLGYGSIFTGTSELHHQLWPWVFRDNPLLASLAVAGVITACAIPLTCYLFLLGYVFRDAKRRGMHAGLWMLLILVLSPAYLAIGFLLYFFMREPLPYACPQCAATVGARFNFCPNCKANLHPACPQCKQPVAEIDKFCPNCACDLKTSGEIAAAS
jgi:hypothetical protein